MEGAGVDIVFTCIAYGLRFYALRRGQDPGPKSTSDGVGKGRRTAWAFDRLLKLRRRLERARTGEHSCACSCRG